MEYICAQVVRGHLLADSVAWRREGCGSCDHARRRRDTFKQTHYEDSGNLSCLPLGRRAESPGGSGGDGGGGGSGRGSRMQKAPGLSENTKEAPRGPDKQTILYQIKKKKNPGKRREEGKTLHPRFYVTPFPISPSRIAYSILD